MRLLITGMGGELGTRVAQLLETDRDVDEIAGLDVDPPRRRLRRAEFHRINPRDRTRSVGVRPRVRSGCRRASRHLRAERAHRSAKRRRAHARWHRSRCSARQPSARRSARSSSAPASRCTGVGVDAPRCPTKTYARDPTSPFGASLAEVEDIAVSAGWAADVPVTLLRMAPVVGPHVPSPLGRYLRMAPIVPISAFADPTFSLLHQEDAVAAVIAAATATPYDGPLNVVGSGAVTAFQAVRLGGRIPLPDPRTRAAAHPSGRRAARLAGAAPRARSPAPGTHGGRNAGERGARHRAAVDGRRGQGPLRVGDGDAPAASQAA